MDVTWCTSVRRSSSLPVAPVITAVVAVDPVSTVRSHGVLIDADLDSVSHTRLVVSRCFTALCQLRRYVTMTVSLVAALIHTRFIYGDFILVGSPAYRLRLLQSVLNAAARLPLRLRRHDHMTDALAVLHWLRILERVVFRLTVTTYRVLYGHGAAPSYLDVLQRTADLPSRRRLRPSAPGRLEVAAHRLATVGRRSFRLAAPTFWNSLPDDVQSAPSLPVFRSRLKTHLFRRSFPAIILQH
jgi:hypothetical protein